MLKIKYGLNPIKNFGNHIKPKKQLEIRAAANGQPNDPQKSFDINKIIKKPYSQEFLAAVTKFSGENKLSRDEFLTNYTKKL